MSRKFTQYFKVGDNEWLSTEYNSYEEFALTRMTLQLLKLPFTIIWLILKACLVLLDKTVGNLLRFVLALCGVSKDILEEYIGPAIASVLEFIVDKIAEAWARVPIRGKAVTALICTITAAALLTNIYYTVLVIVALFSVWLNPFRGRLYKIISPVLNLFGSAAVLGVPLVAYFGFIGFWYAIGFVAFSALIGQLDISSSEEERREKREKLQPRNDYYEEVDDDFDHNMPMFPENLQ